MPIGKYYKGHGEEVMADMTKRYGEKKGKSVFYAKANKDPDMKPPGDSRPSSSGRRYRPAEG